MAVDRDGAVRAMVGGKDYVDSIYNRATQATRQPGSAFKLFVYLSALESGMKPTDTIVDEPVTIDGWSPRNSTRTNLGPVTLREDLRVGLASAGQLAFTGLGGFRGLQAVGGGLIYGTGVAILTSVYPREERGKVLGFNVAAVYSGLSVGPLLGGLLTAQWGWRSIFLATPNPWILS